MSNIIADGLSWNKPDGSNLFNNISFSCNNEITGLVGNNGSGKTVLAKIINGDFTPSAGSLKTTGSIIYVPQDLTLYNNNTILSLFGVELKYYALQNILNGNYTEQDLSNLNDEWDIEEKIYSQLLKFNLQNISFQRKFNNFSGGEKVKAVLCSLFFKSPDYIIFDEPTNHLDTNARDYIYNFVGNSKIGMLIISHDRVLLNLTQRILELSPNKIDVYGGNYNFYHKEKEHLEELYSYNLEKATVELRKTKLNKGKELAKQDSRIRSAESRSFNGGIPKIVLNKRINNGENSSAKIKLIQDVKIETAEQKFTEAKQKYNNISKLKIDYQQVNVPNGKRILEFKSVNFSYDKKPLWQTTISFVLKGNERLHIIGNNGTGKSTIFKLIQGNLLPTSGIIYKGINNIGMLDQDMNMLNFDETVYNNIKNFDTNHLPESELRIRLSRYQFFNYDVFKKVKDLSGGEKIKLGFACLFSETNAPELLLLDEPTNNLDINSIEQLTELLRNYKGALMVISHDKNFINDLNINTTLNLAEYI